MPKEIKAIIALGYDNSITVMNSDENLDYSNIYALLVPVMGTNTESYIYVEMTKHNRFTKAYLDYDLRLNCFSDGNIERTIQLTQGSIETSSLIQFYNLLHSFCRYWSLNCFETCYYPDDINEMLIDAYMFRIRLEDANGEVCYSLNIDPEKLSRGQRSSKIDQAVMKILKRDDSLFRTIGKGDVLRVKKNKWEIVKRSQLKEDDLIGMANTTTSTFLFIQYKDFIDVGYILKNITIEIFIMNNFEYYRLRGLNSSSTHKVLNTDIIPIRGELYWAYNTGDCIAIIDMLPTYVEILKEICRRYYHYYEEKCIKDELNVTIHDCTMLCVEFTEPYHSETIALKSEEDGYPTLSEFVSIMKQLKERIS